jgi:muconolactone delta-isomerase
MKYLVLVAVKPTAQIDPAMLLSHKDWGLQQVAKGVMESLYTFAGTGNGMCILTADTPEQLDDIIASAPAFFNCDLDVRPLADFAAQMDRIANGLKRLG